jgi:hypothetical protein
VADAEHQLALSKRLPAILQGKDKPRDNPERLTLARMACDQKHFVAAARLWSEALESDPKLGDDRQTQHRYNAACAAVLAAAGQGKDEQPPDISARVQLHAHALDWLKAELAAWSNLLVSGPPTARPFIMGTLRHWKVDADLASMRDQATLAGLPAAERKAWQELWSDMDTLLKRAEAGATVSGGQQPEQASGKADRQQP